MIEFPRRYSVVAVPVDTSTRLWLWQTPFVGSAPMCEWSSWVHGAAWRRESYRTGARSIGSFPSAGWLGAGGFGSISGSRGPSFVQWPGHSDGSETFTRSSSW
jgi:hypothetical protein